MSQGQIEHFWNKEHYTYSCQDKIHKFKHTIVSPLPENLANALSPDVLYEVHQLFITKELDNLQKLNISNFREHPSSLQVDNIFTSNQSPFWQLSTQKAILLENIRAAFAHYKRVHAYNKTEAYKRMQQLEQIVGYTSEILRNYPKPNLLIDDVNKYQHNITKLNQIADDLAKAPRATQLHSLGYTLLIFGACAFLVFVLAAFVPAIGDLLTQTLIKAGASHTAAQVGGSAFLPTIVGGAIISWVPMLVGLDFLTPPSKQEHERLSESLKKITTDEALLKSLKIQAVMNALSNLLEEKLVYSENSSSPSSPKCRLINNDFARVFAKNLQAALEASSSVSFLVDHKIQLLLDIDLKKADRSPSSTIRLLAQTCNAPLFEVPLSVNTSSETPIEIFTEQWQPNPILGDEPNNLSPVFHSTNVSVPSAAPTVSRFVCLDLQNSDADALCTALNIKDLSDLETLKQAYIRMIEDTNFQSDTNFWRVIKNKTYRLAQEAAKKATAGNPVFPQDSTLKEFFARGLYTILCQDPEITKKQTVKTKLDSMFDQLKSIEKAIEATSDCDVKGLSKLLGCKDAFLIKPSKLGVAAPITLCKKSWEDRYSFVDSIDKDPKTMALTEFTLKKTDNNLETWVVLNPNNQDFEHEQTKFEKNYYKLKLEAKVEELSLKLTQQTTLEISPDILQVIVGAVKQRFLSPLKAQESFQTRLDQFEAVAAESQNPQSFTEYLNKCAELGGILMIPLNERVSSTSSNVKFMQKQHDQHTDQIQGFYEFDIASQRSEKQILAEDPTIADLLEKEQKAAMALTDNAERYEALVTANMKYLSPQYCYSRYVLVVAPDPYTYLGVKPEADQSALVNAYQAIVKSQSSVPKHNAHTFFGKDTPLKPNGKVDNRGKLSP